MDYKDFKSALDTLDIITWITSTDLKERYLKLSETYHPNMPEGDAEKFREIYRLYNKRIFTP